MDDKNKIDYSEIDSLCIPLVQFFNERGLKTIMSCQGHNQTNMSMYWIRFADEVQEEDIINFMNNHISKYGSFISCGYFAQRITVVMGNTREEKKVCKMWDYYAANFHAALADLKDWMEIEMKKKNNEIK